MSWRFVSSGGGTKNPFPPINALFFSHPLSFHRSSFVFFFLVFLFFFCISLFLSVLFLSFSFSLCCHFVETRPENADLGNCAMWICLWPNSQSESEQFCAKKNQTIDLLKQILCVEPPTHHQRCHSRSSLKILTNVFAILFHFYHPIFSFVLLIITYYFFSSSISLRHYSDPLHRYHPYHRYLTLLSPYSFHSIVGFFPLFAHFPAPKSPFAHLRLFSSDRLKKAEKAIKKKERMKWQKERKKKKSVKKKKEIPNRFELFSFLLITIQTAPPDCGSTDRERLR